MEESLGRNGPGDFVASAYLRHRRAQLELAVRRTFGRKGSSNDLEAQENLISGDGFNDEDLLEDSDGKWYNVSRWTRIILIMSAVTLGVNIFIMIGLDSYISSVWGAVIAFMVGAAQLRLDDLEST